MSSSNFNDKCNDNMLRFDKKKNCQITKPNSISKIMIQDSEANEVINENKNT